MTQDNKREIQMEQLLETLREAYETVNECYRKMDITFGKMLEENPDIKVRWEADEQKREELKQEQKEQENARKEDERDVEKQKRQSKSL